MQSTGKRGHLNFSVIRNDWLLCHSHMWLFIYSLIKWSTFCHYRYWVHTWWTKTSCVPSSGVIKPQPLVTLNHLHFPRRRSDVLDLFSAKQVKRSELVWKEDKFLNQEYCSHFLFGQRADKMNWLITIVNCQFYIKCIDSHLYWMILLMVDEEHDWIDLFSTWRRL